MITSSGVNICYQLRPSALDGVFDVGDMLDPIGEEHVEHGFYVMVPNHLIPLFFFGSNDASHARQFWVDDPTMLLPGRGGVVNCALA